MKTARNILNRKRSIISPTKELTDEHLREADKLVRLKRYEEALLEIENAHKIDPENPYICSFLERTRYMIEKENERRSQVFGETSITSEHRMEAISELFASAEKFIADKKYAKALNELAKVYRIDPKNYNAHELSDRIVTLMRAETATKQTKTPQSIVPEINITPLNKPTSLVDDNVPTQPINNTVQQTTIKNEIQEAETGINRTQLTHSIVAEFDQSSLEKPRMFVNDDVPMQPANISLSRPIIYNEPQEEIRRFVLYKELLKECWADGFITPEESKILHRMRTQYSISFDTHCRIEVGIKIDAYVDTLRIVWQDGVVTNNEKEVLEVMRKKFGITPGEQAAAVEKFLALRKSNQSKAKLLIVDYDQDNSIYAARALMGYGYDVKIEQFPDEALAFLSTHTPNLILSEAVFPQFETDGFEFFQRTRSDERLSQIPFLMMTSSDDSCIMRAGLRMGVDFFIPKPLHIGYMVAIVEGRLKSFQQTTIQN